MREPAQERTRPGGRSCAVRSHKETKVRYGRLRRRGYAQRESAMPWRGYFLSIGGVLLLLLFVADGWMPRTASNGVLVSRLVFPPIRIHSDIRGPEAVVIDTSRTGLPAVSVTETAAAEVSASLSPESSASLDQSAVPSPLQQAAAERGAFGSAAGPVARQAFAQLVQRYRAVSRKPSTTRPALTARRNAQARPEASRRLKARMHYLACDRCGPSGPHQAF